MTESPESGTAILWHSLRRRWLPAPESLTVEARLPPQEAPRPSA